METPEDREIKLENHTLVTEYDSSGNLIIQVYSKGQLVDLIKVNKSIIHQKNLRRRL